nr:Transmembrane protein [Ipomoea batatas]
MVVSALIVWRYEGSPKSRNQQREDRQEKIGTLHKDEVWKTCHKSIHPVCLLTYKVLAFLVLLALLTADAVVHGGGIFYYYTQWTFTLVTIYFGLGSVLSIYGLKSRKEISAERVNFVSSDAERGTYVAPALGDNASAPCIPSSLNPQDEPPLLDAAGFWDYALQIIFQHSVNAVCLLGDVMLNRLRFPFFRIAYFILWTCVFVTFQWIIHMCVSLWWPYSFLDLSSQYAPLWYFGVGALHVPCYVIFALIIRMKKYFLSRFVQTPSEI